MSPMNKRTAEQDSDTITTEQVALDWVANTDYDQFVADYPETGYSQYTTAYNVGEFNGITDPIWTRGWNFDSSGQRLDSDDAALGVQAEARWNNGTQNITEQFWKLIDLNNNEKRPFYSLYYQNDDSVETLVAGDNVRIRSADQSITGWDIGFEDPNNIVHRVRGHAVSWRDKDTNTEWMR